jgi:putative methylase
VQKRAVERRLAAAEGFADPDRELEQYVTPADIAAHLLHVAALRGDLDTTVLDLGTGTGRLALAAALHEPARVVAVERDLGALRVARVNERRVDPPVGVEWLRADATRLPLVSSSLAVSTSPLTVVANPPFGAQDGNAHADRQFLESVAALATDCPVVSYTVHNDGSRAFVESFAADAGATVTDAFAVTFPLPRQFDHQTDASREIQTQVFRVEW